MNTVNTEMRQNEDIFGYEFLTGLTGDFSHPGRHHLPQPSGAPSPKKGTLIQRFQSWETGGMLQRSSDIFTYIYMYLR